MTACAACRVEVSSLPDGERCAECLPVVTVGVLQVVRFGRALFDEVTQLAGGSELRQRYSKLGKERHAVRIDNGDSLCGKLPPAWVYITSIVDQVPWCLECISAARASWEQRNTEDDTGPST